MNCEFARSNAVLYCYDELPDDVRHDMEQHLARCAECSAEIKAVRALQSVMSAAPAEQPSPNLLAASRMKLQEALETAEQKRGWSRWFAADLGQLLHSFKLAPAMAAAIFIIGFGAGIGTTYRIVKAGPHNTPTIDTVPAQEASIGGIRSIDAVPGSKNVQIKYDKVIPDTAQGSLDDPKIQQLLLFAAQNNRSDGMRVDATALLAQQPGNERVRQELIYSLHYDTNPAVRLQAIEALRPFVKSDVRVRDAVLEALMNDSSPGVRTEAIHALEVVKADSSVRHVLQTLARNDKNQYIRQKAREVLNTTPEMD
jgi:hypothetical protein